MKVWHPVVSKDDTMFQEFFYQLRDYGIPVRPTDFLRLQRALDGGLVQNLNDFYTVARTVMVKSERFFDIYDQVFAHFFEGKDIDLQTLDDLNAEMERLLAEWLADPENMPNLT
ncbi:hypothetical protein KDL45_18290, partial [bacterium]|nr:hypothetical protein [bacterium]